MPLNPQLSLGAMELGWQYKTADACLSCFASHLQASAGLRCFALSETNVLSGTLMLQHELHLLQVNEKDFMQRHADCFLKKLSH